MNSINEEFKSQFFKTLNNNLKRNYVEDFKTQKTFIEEITEAFKKCFEYAFNYVMNGTEDKELVKNLSSELDELTKKYNISSYLTDKFKYLLGFNYYGQIAQPQLNINTISSIKSAIKENIVKEHGRYHSNSSRVIRKNQTSSIKPSENSFELISNILCDDWRHEIDLANITDDCIKRYPKIPNLITERSPIYNYFIFWFSSNNPDSDELLPDDEFRGISKGSEVYFPPKPSYKETIKIKDLASRSNKIFILKNDSLTDYYKKINDRKENKVIYKYTPHSGTTYSEPKILDEIPEKIDSNSPNYIKVNDVTYKKEIERPVFSNNEFVRDSEYKEFIAHQIQRYKTLAENIRLKQLEKTDLIDSEVKDTIDNTHLYLVNNKELKTRDLRNVYSKLSSLIDNYEKYVDSKKSLSSSYSDFRKRDMAQHRTNTKSKIDELNKIIKGAN